MILDQIQTTIGYRCPECGTGVMSAIGLFSLKADMIRLKCTCKQSELTLTLSKDNKVAIKAPCIVCPKPHNYVVSSSVLFSRNLFILPCNYSDIDACFIGKEEDVRVALEQNEQQLMEIMRENVIEDFSQFRQEDPTVTDNAVVDIVRFVISDLKEAGELHCKCDEGDYDFEVGDEHVRVFCKNCSAERKILTDSTSAAHDFLHCMSLTLE